MEFIRSLEKKLEYKPTTPHTKKNGRQLIKLTTIAFYN